MHGCARWTRKLGPGAHAAVLWLVSGCSETPPLVLDPGNGASLQYAPDSGALRLYRGGTPLLTLPVLGGLAIGTVPQLEDKRSYNPYWLDNGEEVLPVSLPEDLRWHVADQAEVQKAQDGQLQLALRFDGDLAGTLELAPGGPGSYTARFTPDPGPSGRAVAFLRIAPRPDATEGLYGLGEWADTVNHRGQVRPMQIEFDATESSNNEAHVPVPLLIGTTGWGLFVESQRVGVFDVAHKDPAAVEVTYGTAQDSAAGLRFHLFVADHPLDIPARYFAVTGAPLLPAQWALGPWFWRNENSDQAEVESDIERLRTLDLATSGLWIDRPYATAVNTFDFKHDLKDPKDPSRAYPYPDPAAMIARAHEAGLRVALWSTPYLETAAQPLRGEAEAKGYFPPRSGIALSSWREPIDLTNQEAYRFWQDLIRRYTVGLGIEGFKLDYAEDVVAGLGTARTPWRFADGSDDRTMHYGYTLRYHQVYAETLPQSGGYLLCRAGRWGDQTRVSVIWPGDMDASFTRHREPFTPRSSGARVIGVGGLPATVAQALNLSASGFPFFAADTGGYRHSPPDKELFIRWFQQTALSAVMNVGDASSQPPWEFNAKNGRDQATLDLYRGFARLHMRLFPYEWTYAQRMRNDGRPILRPVGLAEPDLGAHPADEYLFGEELLVAPVVDRGLSQRQVLLPRGGWIGFWDGQMYEGGATVTVPAPLMGAADLEAGVPAGLPLLARAGAIVPLLRPTIDAIAPATLPGTDQGGGPLADSFANDPGVLNARLFPGPAPTRFVVYDGATLTQGPDGAITVADGSVFRQGFLLQRVRTPRPQALLVDGQALQEQARPADLDALGAGWAWTAAAGGTLWLKLPAGAHQATLR